MLSNALSWRERRLDQLVRDDQRDQAVLARQPRRLPVGLAEQRVLGHPPQDRLGAADPVGERALDRGRDRVQERQRQLHDLARDAVGVAQLLDLGLVPVPAGAAGPRPSPRT